MYLASRWLFRNLSRLELAVAWVLILLLIGGFARHMFGVFARAEQSMVTRAVTNIDTALKYHFSMADIRDDHEVLAALKDSSPMDIMQGIRTDYFLSNESMSREQLSAGLPVMAKPGNYGGVVASPDWGQLERGKWYFDSDNQTRVYLLRNTGFFDAVLDSPRRFRFRVEIDYRDNNANNEFDPRVDDYESVQLRRVSPEP